MTTPTPAPTPSGLSPPDSCLSLASTLRCYYSSSGSEIHHILLIIPVALEVIFSTSLIFTNWASGSRRHLFLVVEGWIFFLLALIEVISLVTPAARWSIPIFRGIDQSIGALSFLQIFFYMAFLFAFVRAECLSIVPTRIQRIVRPLLLISIPPIIAVNTIASFAGVVYQQGPQHVKVFFDERARFIWTFFSSITLALFTTFQAACFCFAFYRLIRAMLRQRSIETDSKDAAVLFKGIGWINAGIKLGAIETLIGFVFFGIPIAYARRVIRLLGRALLCIGVAKGVDATEDFEAIRSELESKSSSARGLGRSQLRGLISGPRLSTFRQLSPTATAFHEKPRAPPPVSYSNAAYDGTSHPYSGDGLTLKKSIRSSYDSSSPIIFKEKLAPLPSGPAQSSGGLPGMDEFAKIKAQRMSQYSSKSRSHVTIQYDQGTPSLHLRLSGVELPTPAVMVRNIRIPTNDSLEEYQKSYGQSVEAESLHKYDTHAYSDRFSKSSYSSDSYSTYGYGVSDTPKTLGHGPPDTSDVLEPPAPAYLAASTQRSSDYSGVSDLSAAQAEIIDTPRSKLSFLGRKSAIARAMLYPVPSTKVALSLSGSPNTRSPVALPWRSPNLTVATLRSTIDEHLPATQQSPSAPPPMQQASVLKSQVPTSQQKRQQRTSTVASVVDNYASRATISAVVPPLESAGYSSDGSKRETRSITLQAVHDLAIQFPGPPPGAVVANIGIQAANVTGRNTESSTGHFDKNKDGSSSGHGTSTAESTDTEEVIRRRIPAESKKKGKPPSATPSIPLPPLPDLGPLRAPPRSPTRKVKNPRSIPHMQSLEQVLSQAQASPVPFTAHPIDPFDDDDTTSYRGTTSELSPLSMSVKLRHPQSFISTMYPSTNRSSKVTMAGIMSPTTPLPASLYQQALSRATSTSGQTSPGVLDFGSTLKEWNLAGLQTMGMPLTGTTHRRSLSAQTRDEFERQQRKVLKDVVLTSELDLSDELPDQLRDLQQPNRLTGGVPLNRRIKSIGKAPRRTTPQPTKSPHVRGSMHLQHLVIPVSSSSQDVPISAVEAGGVPTILGVDRTGMNIAIAQDEQDELMPMSAATEGAMSTHGGGMMRSLSILDGGHVPIKLQRGRKDLY